MPLFAGTPTSSTLDAGVGSFSSSWRSAAFGRAASISITRWPSSAAPGLDVTEADAVGYLSALPDESLGGMFAAQVVEHLQPGYLLRFLELAFHKLRPGGTIVLETLNPACWVAFFDSYIRDITHVWPLHPETLRYLVLASGFTARTSNTGHLSRRKIVCKPSSFPRDADARLADVAEAFNANVEKLNARLFTYRDYAVIGGR